LHNLTDDTLFLPDCFCQRNNNLDYTESILVEAQLVEIGIDFLKDKVLLNLVKAAALEHLSDNVSALLID
jgi:hypothetical protein